jgi:hypothetical protein
MQNVARLAGGWRLVVVNGISAFSRYVVIFTFTSRHWYLLYFNEELFFSLSICNLLFLFKMNFLVISVHIFQNGLEPKTKHLSRR